MVAERSYKRRCYACDEYGHLISDCPKRRKPSTSTEGLSRRSGRESSTRKTVSTCSYCAKKGTRGIPNVGLSSGPFALREIEKNEVNVCTTEKHKLTPILLRGTMIHCLLDSGADCSLIKEGVFKRINGKMHPQITTMHGLGNVPIKNDRLCNNGRSI